MNAVAPTPRQFGQARFLVHDALACGLFNRGYTGATGAHSSWESVMMNNNDILTLVIDRMRSDWENQPVKLRTPWTAKSVDPR